MLSPFRPAPWSLVIVSGLLWFCWTLSGIVNNRFQGWHDFFFVIMVATVISTVAVGEIPPNKCNQQQRAEGITAKKALGIAFALWLGVTILVVIARKHLPSLGPAGDTYGIVNSLFLALGFFFTVRQLQHQEQSHRETISRQAIPQLLEENHGILLTAREIRKNLDEISLTLAKVEETGKIEDYPKLPVLQLVRDYSTLIRRSNLSGTSNLVDTLEEFHAAVNQLETIRINHRSFTAEIMQLMLVADTAREALELQGRLKLGLGAMESKFEKESEWLRSLVEQDLPRRES